MVIWPFFIRYWIVLGRVLVRSTTLGRAYNLPIQKKAIRITAEVKGWEQSLPIYNILYKKYMQHLVFSNIHKYKTSSSLYSAMHPCNSCTSNTMCVLKNCVAVHNTIILGQPSWWGCKNIQDVHAT